MVKEEYKIKISINIPKNEVAKFSILFGAIDESNIEIADRKIRNIYEKSHYRWS